MPHLEPGLICKRLWCLEKRE